MGHLRFDSLVEIEVFFFFWVLKVKKTISGLRISLKEVVEWSLVQALRNPALFPGGTVFSLRLHPQNMLKCY